MAVTEHVMDHLAVACKVPVDVLRRSNMYKEGDAGESSQVGRERRWE